MRPTLIALIAATSVCACGPHVSVGDLGGAGVGSSAAEVGGAANPGPPSSGGSANQSSGGDQSVVGYAGDPNAAGAAGGVGWTDPTSAPDCKVSPLATVMYTTEAQLDALLVRRWRRCIAPQVNGEDVGVEFTADGKYYTLTFDASHQVVRQVGIDYGGDWVYYPVGSKIPASPSQGPLSIAEINLSGEYTNAPIFTTSPVQMRVLFSPVQSIYVPLDP